MVKITLKYKLPVVTPVSKHITVKYHRFKEKITNGYCSVKKVDGKDQKADTFTKGIQEDILLHIIKLMCGWFIKAVVYYKSMKD